MAVKRVKGMLNQADKETVLATPSKAGTTMRQERKP